LAIFVECPAVVGQDRQNPESSIPLELQSLVREGQGGVIFG
jgi:hypothetical protein